MYLRIYTESPCTLHSYLPMMLAGVVFIGLGLEEVVAPDTGSQAAVARDTGREASTLTREYKQ